MFKNAAVKGATSTATKTSQINSYVRVSPVKSNPPLNPVSGNATKRPTGQQPTKTGLKRSASGLVKALSSSNDFDEPPYPTLPTSANSQNKPPSNKTYLDGLFFDENDFDDDFDLDVEQITARHTVTYPDLSPRLTNQGAHANSTPDVPISWSSSPVEHFQPMKSKALINTFRHSPYSAQKPRQDILNEQEQNPRPAKRRNLPWEARAKAELQQSNKTTTPASSLKYVNPAFSWNVSASAMKQQQKSIREANKKRVKTTETDDARATAIESRKRSRVHRIFLSDEQQAVLNMVVEEGKSLFFTGSAGTGKSVLLREIIAALRKKHRKDPDRIAITASTGLAACNIGGITIHSFAGIGLGRLPVEELVKGIKKNQKSKHRWMRTKILIIDEVSMVDGELYDKLEAIARRMKNNGRPFGGIQVIITGDFFQLPPVPDGGRQAKFAFNANTWNTTIEKTIALHKVFRQKDPEFASMLNQMREGRLDSKSIAKFRTLNRELKFDDDLEATELFSTRNEVERANTTRIAHLSGDSRVFEARDGGSVTDLERRNKLLSHLMAPERITLKKGAQVMLIKNYDDTLVNGSLGKVIGFMSEAEFSSYHDDEEAYLSTQVPQFTRPETGKTIVDVTGTGASNIFPVVRFAIADGTTRDLLCHREQWSVELPNGEVQASRSQIPLILAWALSIHKAQGQTLERVKVNLSKAFERGQAYVALSRATSMAGLQVIGFDPAKVMAHDAVRRFYASLSRIEDANAKEKGLKVSGAYPVDDVKSVVGGLSVAGSHFDQDIPLDFFDEDFD